MVDLRLLTDDEVIAMAEVSKGYDRELIVGFLAHSSGRSGVAYLRSLLTETGRGSGHLRTVALRALSARLGQDAAPDLVAALVGGTLHTQLPALWCLERVDDGRCADDVFRWFRRRLRNPGRAKSWGHYEVSGVLRYAYRVDALPTVLDVLETGYDKLQPEERDRLDSIWPQPNRARFRSAGDLVDGPDLVALEAWYRLTVVDSVASGPDEPIVSDEFQTTAIDRARRRLSRP